jgi:hypothetical protein
LLSARDGSHLPRYILSKMASCHLELVSLLEINSLGTAEQCFMQ